MAFARKILGSGFLSDSTTSMYSPAATNLTGVIASASFFNESTTDQVKVTIYEPYTSAPTNVLDEVTINPRKSYLCRVAVNKVVDGSYTFGAVADTASVISYSVHGGEE